MFFQHNVYRPHHLPRGCYYGYFGFLSRSPNEVDLEPLYVLDRPFFDRDSYRTALSYQAGQTAGTNQLPAKILAQASTGGLIYILHTMLLNVIVRCNL
jgi:hypothetical protein